MCFQVIVTIKRVVCFHRASYRHATYVMFALAARPSSCSSLGTAYQSEVNSWEERTSFPPLAASAFPRHLHALNPTRAPLRKMNLVTSVSRLLRSHCRNGIFLKLSAVIGFHIFFGICNRNCTPPSLKAIPTL